MKTFFVIAATGLAGYLIWDYYNKQVKGKCSCSEESTTTTTPVQTKEPLVRDSVMEVYDASRDATLPTPRRLIIGAGTMDGMDSWSIAQQQVEMH